MQMLRSFTRWYQSQNSAVQIILQNLFVWTIALAIIWYVARGLTIHQMADALKRSDIALFVGANVSSFAVRWLADTYLFSRLFSFFHRRTTYCELLPASTAQYFLQAFNVLVADGAMVLFLHQRKGVEWITAGWTLVFQGFVDAILMAALTVVLGVLAPFSPIHAALPYAAAALGFLLCAAAWWMWGRSSTRLGRWLRNRQGMRAFRLARPYHFAVLGLIRAAIYVPNALSFYIYLVSFHLSVPLLAVVALSPALMFAQSAPITPSGLGPLQAVMVSGFSNFAPRSELLTAALGVSIVQLLCRVPMGLGAAGTFARRVLAAEKMRHDEPDSRRSDAAAGS
jgi:uncharacterized membrane protein YbhN (UPF0104 family)